MKSRSLLYTSLLFVIIGAAISPYCAADAPKKAKPAIYDESLDGAKQVTDAMVVAKKENKRILLQFGANWCGWCHRLHDLFKKNASIAAKLKANYVVVLIDVNKGHNKETNAKYGNPTRNGLPVIVILDADGTLLTTKDTGTLEEGGGHSPQKVMQFLTEWAPKK
ncbi:MAG: thioredoxin family protein [Opitutaceae bacterium]|jgi:thioredoxin-related protein